MTICSNGHDSASDDFCDVCGMRIGGNTGTAPSAAASAPPPRPGPPAAESCPRCGTARIGQFCEACGFNFGTSFTPAVPTFTPAPPPGPSPSHSLPPGPSPSPSLPSGPSPSLPSGPSPSLPSGPSPSLPSGPQVPPASPFPPGPQPSPSNSFPSGPQTPPAFPFPPGPQSQLPPSYPAAPSSPPAPSSFPYSQATWTAIVGADRAYFERVQAVTGPEGAAVAFPSYCAERRFQLLGNQMRIGRRSVSRGLAPEIDLTGPPADPGISRLHAVLVAVSDGSWAVLDPGSANGTLVNGTEIAIGDQITLHDGDRINLGAWTAITVHQD
jgi:hypothetical protein